MRYQLSYSYFEMNGPIVTCSEMIVPHSERGDSDSQVTELGCVGSDVIIPGSNVGQVYQMNKNVIQTSV